MQYYNFMLYYVKDKKIKGKAMYEAHIQKVKSQILKVKSQISKVKNKKQM